MTKNNKFGFTLLELLIVVLIIGILAAIALPRYQESVEKSIMQEAMVNLRAIANANERFYMTNGRYANYTEISKLDITIPGEINDSSQTGLVGDRVVTKYFVYSPDFSGGGAKAVAIRIKNLGVVGERTVYDFSIRSNNKFSCTDISSKATPVQRKLCNRINNTGNL